VSRLSSLLVFIVGGALLALAAEPLRAQMRYAWQVSLPGTGVTVQTVALDARGMLVVGTSRGLYRYDGVAFDPVDLGPGPNGSVWRLEPSSDGAIWAAMPPSGLVRIARDGTVRRIPFPPGFAREGYRLNVAGRRMRPDAQGVWIGLARTLWRYDLATNRWENRTLASPLRTRSFTLHGDTLWMADSVRVGYSLLDRHGRPGRPRWSGSEVTGFSTVEAHPQGGVWALRPNGLFRVTVPRGDTLARWRAVGPAFRAEWYSTLPFVTPDGGLLAAVSTEGMSERTVFVRLDAEGRPLLIEPNADLLAYNTLAVDREDGLWVAAGEGLAHLDRPGVQTVRLIGVNGHEDAALGVHLTPRGVWLETYNGLHWANQDGSLARCPVPHRNETFDVAFATPEGRAYITTAPQGRWLVAEPGCAALRPTAAVPLLRRRDGSLLEAHRDGLYARRGSTTRRLWATPQPGALRPVEWTWPGAAQSVTWLGEDRALVGDSLVSSCRRCAPEGMRRALAALLRFQVNGAAVDPQQRLWVAHRDGLERLDPHPNGTFSLHHFDVGDGEVGSGESISISPDRKRLWVGTNHGLLAYALRDRMDTLGTPLFRLSRRFALGGEAVSDLHEDDTGQLWTSVSPGRIHRVDWRRLRREASPKVEVIEVLRNNVPVPSDGGPVRLEAGRDGMRLRLWPATYIEAARVRLEYRLAGLDSAWTNLGLDRTLRFGSLPRGRFRLEVRAVREGQAPGPPFVLPIVSAPPFYRAPWFLGLVAMLSALVAGGLVYLAQAQRRAEERLRWGLARDLHDDLGSGLAQISVLSELLHRRADPEAAAWAERVGHEARSLTARMRDLVWAIRPDEVDAEPFSDRLRAEANALLGPADLPFTVEGSDESEAHALPPDVRRALLLAVREMLANVVRHAHATRVTVRYRHEGHRLVVAVEDNGVGLPGSDRWPGTSPNEGGFGLVGLRQRAETLGGHFDLAPTPGGGTTATFDVPLRQVFWPLRGWPARSKSTQTGRASSSKSR